MNQKLVVVLLLVTIVLSITSMAIVFNIPTINVNNFAKLADAQPQAASSVGFVIESVPEVSG